MSSDIYRVSYPPFQTASENQYISIQKYLSNLKIDGGAEQKQLLQRILQYMAPHILIDSDSGIPLIKKTGQRLKTPITQLISYFFPIKFSMELPLSGQPIDADEFLQFLKAIKLPSKYLKMVVKSANL